MKTAMSTFGELVAKHRKEKGWLQKELAQRAAEHMPKGAFSGTAVSRIETGDLSPSQEAGTALIKALDLAPEAEESLVNLLRREIKEAKDDKPSRGPFVATGDALERIISELKEVPGFEVGNITDFLNISRQVFHYWRSGLELPPVPRLIELMKFFEKVGVAPGTLRDLRVAFAEDKLIHSGEFDFLKPEELKLIVACLKSRI